MDWWPEWSFFIVGYWAFFLLFDKGSWLLNLMEFSNLNCKCSFDYSIYLRLYSSCSAAVEKFLLYAKKQEIRGVHLESAYLNVMPAMTVPNVYTPVTLDYDEKRERIYWTDDSHLNGQLGLHSNGIRGMSFETLDSGLHTINSSLNALFWHEFRNITVAI